MDGAVDTSRSNSIATYARQTQGRGIFALFAATRGRPRRTARHTAATEKYERRRGLAWQVAIFNVEREILTPSTVLIGFDLVFP